MSMERTDLQIDTLEHILIVDDEPEVCHVCARALLRQHYQVTQCFDATEAAQLLRSGVQFDLLLTDIRMPKISGLDLAHIAHENDPEMAVVIMSGYESLEYLHQSVQRGAADFLVKPFEIQSLQLAVRQALHKRSVLRDNMRLRTLEQLLAGSESLLSTLEFAPLVDQVLHVVIQQSGCLAAFVLYAGGETPLAHITPSQSGYELLGDGITLARRVYDARKPLLGAGAFYCRAGGMMLDQAFAVPLRSSGTVSGVLVLCDTRPGVFRPVTREGVLLLCNIAGAALQNAFLHTQLGEAYRRQQELDRLKREFIAVASHELRTPLGIVLGCTRMLAVRSESEQRELVDEVHHNAQRIKTLVDDMVTLHQVDTGESTLALEPLVLHDLIRLVLVDLAPDAAERQVSVAECLPERPISIRGDRERLLLVIRHLIANAIKFTPAHGQVGVELAIRDQSDLQQVEGRVIVPLRPSVGDRWVVLIVSDTGIGISEDQQAQVFERFYQVADSLVRDHGGLGLGLALVRELLELMHGALWVKSSPTAGSAFVVALPTHLPPDAD